MKKIRRIIIIISLLLVLLSLGLVGYHFYEQSQKEPEVPIVASVIGEDAELMKNSNEKFRATEKSVFIKEGTDGKFTEGDKSFEKSISYIRKSFFDRVYIESEYFTSGKNNADTDMTAVSYAVSRIRQEGRKAVVAINISASSEDILKILSVADGVLLKSDSALTEEAVGAIKQIREKAEEKIFVLDIPTDSESLKKLDKDLTESVCVRVSDEEDVKSIIALEKELTEMEIKLTAVLDFTAVDGEKVSVGTPLKSLYEMKNCKSINEIGFSYLKNIRKNLHNSFSAVKTYMTKGICPEIAFREVGVDCYAGDVKTAELFTAEFTVYGSNLFPVIIDGKNYGVPASGSMTIKHDLSAEENILNISQNESKAEYKVNCAFNENIVRYIMPDSVISAQPNEKVPLMIVAHCKAEITVRLGTERFEAVCDKDADGYTAFVCQITMPSSEEEVASLGKVTVLVSFAGKTIQLEGPSVSAEKEQTTAENGQTLTTQPAPSTRYEIGNYLQELQSDAFEISQKITTTRTYTPTTTYTYTPFTGNQMCVVTAAYADTKPIAAEDNLVPYYTVLPNGTMDYVVGESEGYNIDDEETEYYYNLQSGRKIKREAVQLIPKTEMGDNSLQVISCSSSGGKVRIVLSTRWKVPYDLHYTPQNYYYNYSKHYNVTSFTASTIEFTFHYTSSAAGEIDTSGSDVISSAYWSVNESAKTAKLIMPLKAQGRYYGTSIEYDSAGNMVITVNRKPTGATGAVVVLDAGHGGRDPGAVGINDQVRECDVNILVTYAAMQELQARGVTVYLTRYGDDYMLLEERKAITRSIKPDLFVSIHSNGSLKKTNIGTSTYYFKPFSYPLATNIYNELLSVHRNYFYPGQQELYGELADGVQYYPFGVTRIEDCPSTLIEIGYLTNDAECYKLIDTNNQKLLGKAIADGIINTLS